MTALDATVSDRPYRGRRLSWREFHRLLFMELSYQSSNQFDARSDFSIRQARNIAAYHSLRAAQ